MIAFESRQHDEQEVSELGWQRVDNPPHLVNYGNSWFVETPPYRKGAHGVRAYVNGFPVVGLHAVKPGDLVRIVPGRRNEKKAAYRVGRTHAGVEPGEGRRCSFTGLPIEGTAIQCPQCGRLFKEEIRCEMRACPICGTPFEEDASERPPEELL